MQCMLWGMITKQKYIEYLVSHLCPRGYADQSHQPEHLEDISHDVVGDHLKRDRITARQVWGLMDGLIKNTGVSFLIIDDSVQNKQYSKLIGLVKRQYSGGRPTWCEELAYPLGHKWSTGCTATARDTIPLTTGFMTTPPMARPKMTTSVTCWSMPQGTVAAQPSGLLLCLDFLESDSQHHKVNPLPDKEKSV